MNNFYETLGLTETANQDEIKKAYRKLSLQYHPDRNNNSPESTLKFQNINAAYDIIGDEDKRRTHDMQNKMPFGKGSGIPSFFSHTTSTPTSGEFDPSDILNFISSNFFNTSVSNSNGQNVKFGGNMFNMENIKQRLTKPTPIIKTETITLSKAFTGYNMPIEITRWIIENDIKREETETIYIPIPCGVDNNEIIILREKGNVLSENNKGDIKVFIKIHNDTDFTRNGLDLILDKKIKLKDALCGFVFDMNYLDGRTFKINNNVGNIITNNYNKVLPNMGMKREDHVGNLIINFSVTFPEQLTIEQINALQEIL
jgi:DnaJ-class molecular chaperone